MPISSILNPAQRIGKIKGMMLPHAIATTALGAVGVNDNFKKNAGNQIVYRRALPRGATSTQYNRFFQDGTGDRSAALANAYESSEGVTPAAETISMQDITATLKQFVIVCGYTDQAEDLHEDDLPAIYLQYVGETQGLVNEANLFGVAKACTNKFYGGTGNSRATVNGVLTINLLRRVARSLMANNAKPIKSMQMLGKAGDYATSPIGKSFPVWIHTDLCADVEQLEGYVRVHEYGDTSLAVPNEVGFCNPFRFIASPDLVEVQDAGAAIAGAVPALKSKTGTSADVYQVIVGSQDAWGHLGLRKEMMKPSVLTPGTVDKSDPAGQRGLVSLKWYYHAVLLNSLQMAVVEVASRALTD